MSSGRDRYCDFDGFRLDLDQRVLLRDGQPLRLAPQLFETLVLQVEKQGQVVSKEEFTLRLWKNTAVGESNLAQNILKLRRFLSELSEGKEFIETFPKRGYRFVGGVRWSGSEGALAAETEAASEPATPPSIGIKRRLWLTAAAVFVVSAALVIPRATGPRQPRVLNVIEVTHDGFPKSPYSLASDGSRLYFRAGDPGAARSVPINGGESTPVNTLQGFDEIDICPDGSEFVAGKPDPPLDPELWEIPARSGVPHPLGTLTGVSPAWSPDGKEIAYGHGPNLLVTHADGSDPRVIARMPSEVGDAHWRPDGKVIRFSLQVQNRGYTIWEVHADGTGLGQVVRRWGNSAYELNGRWTADGRFFVFVHGENDHKSLWARQEKCGVFFWECGKLFQLTTGPESYAVPLPSSDGKRIYAIGSKDQMQLMRYDLPLHSPVPYPALVGTPAGQLDFSRDGQWIAYMNLADRSIYRSRIDGSEKTRLTYPPVLGDQPHFSPDGKQIAFLDEAHGRFKLSIVPAEGGPVTQLLPGESEEGVATWSPDGKNLVYGEPIGHEPSAMSIHLLNLETHRVSELPASEGLWTARWSPDGHYIGALVLGPNGNPDSPALRLFDVAEQKWTTIAEFNSVNSINQPNWSQDSKFLYFDTMGDDAALYRIRIADHHLEFLADLRGVPRHVDNWSGAAPDGSPLIVKDTTISEIYALDMEWP